MTACTGKSSQKQARLIDDLNPLQPVIFRSNHASNALALAGNLPKDKDRLLLQLCEAMAEHPKLWTRLYYRYSSWGDHVSRLLNVRLFKSIANTYIITAVPILVIAGVFYLFLLVLSPGLIGYRNGQEAAERFKAERQPETCTPKRMVGCTQILQAGKIVAAGKLIVASEKQAAIFDGYTVQIYSLNNRDIKTILSVK
jgi:hypothetical protein